MPDSHTCPSWDVVLAALQGELSNGESARARAHLASCAACARLAKLHADLDRARLAAPRGDAGACPSPEILAAWAAGDPGAPGSEAIEIHLARCSECRWAVSDEPEASSTLPARLLARARSAWQQIHPVPASAVSVAPVIPLRRGAPWTWVAASLAAGMLGGVVAVRWLAPVAPASAPAPVVAQAVPAVTPDVSKDLARRQEALESRTAGLERQLSDRRAAPDAAASGVKELAASLESVRQDVAALGEVVRARVASPSGGPVPAPADVLAARLARLQEEMARIDAGLTEVRTAGAQAGRDLAEARQANARAAEQIRSLEDRLALSPAVQPPLVALAVPPDFDALFLSARQGTREEYQQALDVLGSQRLDTLGHAVAYYAKDAPKDRRSQAGEELSRRGAKTVDRDLILALAHGQPAVRREAAALLTRNRTRGQDFGYVATAAPEDRQRAVLRAVRWWENEYRDDFPEKAQLQQAVTVVLPVSPVKPAGSAAPAAVPAPAPVPPPPQYNPPK